MDSKKDFVERYPLFPDIHLTSELIGQIGSRYQLGEATYVKSMADTFLSDGNEVFYGFCWHQIGVYDGLESAAKIYAALESTTEGELPDPVALAEKLSMRSDESRSLGAYITYSYCLLREALLSATPSLHIPVIEPQTIKLTVEDSKYSIESIRTQTFARHFWEQLPPYARESYETIINALHIQCELDGIDASSIRYGY